MSTTPTAIRVAQTVGITSAAFCAGGTLCITYLTVPSLFHASNTVIARQWQQTFNIGKIVHPGIALLSSAAYGYLAYQMKGTLNQHKAEMYGLCIISNLLMWPWTIFVMMPTNKKLFKKYDESMAVKDGEQVTEVGTPKGESTRELVTSWSQMNIVRAFMPFVGAVLGLWASLD